MEEKDKFLGCFVSCQATVYDANKAEKDKLIEQELYSEECRLFRIYIWGEGGIGDALKKLRNENYGNDIAIVLFQFYIKPIPYLLNALKEIENYRKKEKSIGVSIVVTDENFFNKSEEGRYNFLKDSILQKLGLLNESVKKKKLDTNMELLIDDVKKVLA